jgi:hydrogenase maturation protease
MWLDESTNAPRTLVLGLGNILLQDEGVGVRAVQRLAAQGNLPKEVQPLDGGTRGLNLLPYLAGVRNLMILDAIDAGQSPGSLVRLEGDAIHAALKTKTSMHQVGLQELLAVSKFQGTLPPRIVLWGIQPAVLDWGMELSPPVQAQLEGLVRRALAEIEQWESDTENPSV